MAWGGRGFRYDKDEPGTVCLGPRANLKYAHQSSFGVVLELSLN